MNRYDIIYSLGRDCSCAMYMQQTNLRSCSGPFDWLTNAGFEKRFELMINNFDEFLEQSDLLPMDKPTAFPSDKNNDYYENVKTGLYYWHDFPAGVPLQESFNIVKEKYNRRIKRFYDNILTKNRVLLIWFSQVGSTSDSVVLEYCDKLCSKIGKKLDFLIIEHREGVFEPQCIRHPIGSASREKDLVFLSELGYEEEHDFWIATRKDYVQRPEVKVLIECIRDATLKI